MTTPLFNSVTLRGGQQKEYNTRTTTPLRHQHINLPQRNRDHSTLQIASQSSPLSRRVVDTEPLTTDTKSRFAIWSRTSLFPIDSIAANDILRGIPSQSRKRSYSMLSTPPKKEGNASTVESKEIGDRKRNSIVGLSFSFPSLTSPTRKGLINTVTNTIVPGRRPDTPPAVSKAWQGPTPSTSKFKDSRTSRQSPGRITHASPVDRSRTVSTKGLEDQGIHSWTDSILASMFTFDKEIGFGNWGSCWLAETRTKTEESGKGVKVAIKLVHREGTAPSNARVKALWNEFKVLRSCGKPLQENLVSFKEFVITPSYALIIMEYYQQTMNVALPISTYAGSTGYFQQLLLAINWLHMRSVTHCDIKVANLLVDTTHDKEIGRPILVDFGFATLHDAKSSFKSKQTWGTPEYLSPERSKGELHDERLSDMWALGVTFFEIATGRTPFEHEDEQFLSKEQLEVYYQRTLSPKWVGSWSIPRSLESLCRLMLFPDPKDRIFSGEALLHPFFSKPGVYYESTVSRGTDDDHYQETISCQNEQNSSDKEEAVKEKRILDVRINRSTKTKPPPPPLKVPASDKHLEQISPFASPRANPKEMRQSLKVPESSPLSSYQLGAEIERFNDDGIVEPQLQIKEGSAHLQGSTEIHCQSEKGECRSESSLNNLSSNVEEMLSSSGEAAKFGHRAEADKTKRPRPKTFHGAMFQTQEIRRLKSSEQSLDLIRKPTMYQASNDEGFKRGYEIMPERQTSVHLTKDSGYERGLMNKRIETIASKAQIMQTELQHSGSKEELSLDCSDSSAVSQAHTEELAARLDEMGILAANLARMVEESKSKLNHLHESSMARSAASLHREKWSKAGGMQSPSHIRQYSGGNQEMLSHPASVHSQSYAATSSNTPGTPSSASKAKGLSILKPGSLHKKVSLTSWTRKGTVASTVPFPSEGVFDQSVSSSQRWDKTSTGQTPARLQHKFREASSPRVNSPGHALPRNNLTRASSGRGRALSHFLTRYGSRNTRSASIVKTSTELEENEITKTSSTLCDKSGSSEGFYSNRTSTKTKATTALSKHFFDDEGVVEIASSDHVQQSKEQRGSTVDIVKSPLQSRHSITASRHMSRVYQSPTAATVTASPSLLSRKQSIIRNPMGKAMGGIGHKTSAVVSTPKSPVGNQRERTLSKMKSFTLGRSNTNSRRDESNHHHQKLTGGSKTARGLSIDQCSSRQNQEDSSEVSTASSPLEPISPRHQSQFPILTPLTPMIGEDPPRHYQRSHESSSQSHQSPHLVNTPSTPGSGLWSRLFRGNNNNSINGSSRLQSPRAN